MNGGMAAPFSAKKNALVEQGKFNESKEIMSESIVSVNNNQLVTTSLAIAQNTDNDHASVIKLVRSYQADLEEFGLLDFKSESSGGRPTEYAELNEQQSTLILTYMRNSEIVRAFKKRLVKEFWNMRAKLSESTKALNPANFSRMQLIELAMQAEQERLVLEVKVNQQTAALELQAPKVAALDLIHTADGMLNLQAAGKTLQQQPNKFIAWLRENGWIYKRPGSTNNCARAEKFNAGYLTTKAHTVIQPDGTERVREQVMVTPKGLAKLAGVFGGGVTA